MGKIREAFFCQRIRAYPPGISGQGRHHAKAEGQSVGRVAEKVESMIDKKHLFDTVRHALFDGKLNNDQVNGMDEIIDYYERKEIGSRRKLAYILATVYHETAKTMQPIKERGGDNYFIMRYWNNRKVAKALGNRSDRDAVMYCGRGFVQLTGRRNYTYVGGKIGMDLERNPNLAMDLKVATKILFMGMEEGWFTRFKLSTFINKDKTDFINARRIINGTDKAVLIALYAEKYLIALSS